QATVVVDALEGRSYEGHVARISPLLDPTTRSGSVEIEIPNSDGQLKAEMFARIQMDLGTDRQVLLVPRDAVILRGQQTGVNVLLSDRVQFRPIETGASTEQGIEVLAGVDAGTTVITRGSQGLKDGDLVVVPGRQSALPTPEDRS
ncbi:MAG: efflux RND transporter periplasmic adaptor subunit, partial [Acidobacteria bacterium]|nr:efflux RND transporter periplasmic adaptor subunit [Acidobacteriota bacterium]